MLVIFPVAFAYLELHGELRSVDSIGSLDEGLPLMLAFLVTATVLFLPRLVQKSTRSDDHLILTQLESRKGYPASSIADHKVLRSVAKPNLPTRSQR